MLVPIAFGIGGALTAAVGANFGAQQYARARRIAWSGAGASMLLVGSIGLIVALAPDLWLSRFTADLQAYAFGESYLSIAAPFYGLFGAVWHCISRARVPGGCCCRFWSVSCARQSLWSSAGWRRLVRGTSLQFLLP